MIALAARGGPWTAGPGQTVAGHVEEGEDAGAAAGGDQVPQSGEGHVPAWSRVHHCRHACERASQFGE